MSKELNEELGIQWHDFGYRNYDASLGKWMNIDPLSETYINNSPFPLESFLVAVMSKQIEVKF